MPLDPSILLQGRGVQLPDPMEGYQKAMALSQLAQAGQLQRMQIDKYKRDQDSQDAIGGALGGLNLGDDAAVARAVTAIPPHARTAFYTYVNNWRKEQAEAKSKQATTTKTEVETNDKLLARLGAQAMAMAQDPQAGPNHLATWTANARALGVDTSNFPSAMSFGSPKAALDAYGRMTIDAARQVEHRMTGARDQRTAQHYDATEQGAVADRGQRMTIAQMNDARQREQAGAMFAQAGATREVAAANRIGPLGERTTSLRKEFASLPQVKNYVEVAPILEAVRKAPNTPQGDLQLIYGVGKIMDPESVVREGEMDLVIKSGSPAERMQGFISYIQGGGKFTPSARARLVRVLEGAVQERKSQYEAAKRTYSGIAQRGGVTADDVFAEIPGGGSEWTQLPGGVSIRPKGP